LEYHREALEPNRVDLEVDQEALEPNRVDLEVHREALELNKVALEDHREALANKGSEHNREDSEHNKVHLEANQDSDHKLALQEALADLKQASQANNRDSEGLTPGSQANNLVSEDNNSQCAASARRPSTQPQRPTFVPSTCFGIQII